MAFEDFDFDDDPVNLDSFDNENDGAPSRQEEAAEHREELSDIYDIVQEPGGKELLKEFNDNPEEFEHLSDQDEEDLDFGEEDEDGDFDISHLPEELQDQLLAAQEEMEEAFAERLERLEGLENELVPVNGVIDHWSGYLNQLGVDPATAFNALIEADYALRNGSPEQKQAYLAYLASTYGVDQGSQQSGNGEWVDPDIQRLENRIAQMQQQQYQQQQFAQQQQMQAYEAQQLEEASYEVEDFAEAETEDGELAYPLLDFVDEQMAVLLERGLANSLEDAYEQAVWSDPDCRSALLEFERDMLAQQRSERARSMRSTSNASVRSRNEMGRFTAKHDSLRDELGAIYDELNP